MIVSVAAMAADGPRDRVSKLGALLEGAASDSNGETDEDDLGSDDYDNKRGGKGSVSNGSGGSVSLSEESSSVMSLSEDSVYMRSNNYGTSRQMEEVFRQSLPGLVKATAVSIDKTYFTGKGRNNNKDIYGDLEIEKVLNKKLELEATRTVEQWDTKARKTICNLVKKNQRLQDDEGEGFGGGNFEDSAMNKELRVRILRNKHAAVKNEESQKVVASRYEKKEEFDQKLAPRSLEMQLHIERVKPHSLAELASPRSPKEGVYYPRRRPSSAPSNVRKTAALESPSNQEGEQIDAKVEISGSGNGDTQQQPKIPKTQHRSHQFNRRARNMVVSTQEPPFTDGEQSKRVDIGVPLLSMQWDKEDVSDDDDTEWLEADHPLNAEQWCVDQSKYRHRLAFKRRAMLSPRVKDAKENVLRAKGLYKEPNKISLQAVRNKMLQVGKVNAMLTSLRAVANEKKTEGEGGKETEELSVVAAMKKRMEFREAYLKLKSDVESEGKVQKPFAWLNDTRALDNEALGLGGNMFKMMTLKPNRALLKHNEQKLNKDNIVYFVNHGKFQHFEGNTTQSLPKEGKDAKNGVSFLLDKGVKKTDEVPGTPNSEISDGEEPEVEFYYKMYKEVFEKLEDSPLQPKKSKEASGSPSKHPPSSSRGVTTTSSNNNRHSSGGMKKSSETGEEDVVTRRKLIEKSASDVAEAQRIIRQSKPKKASEDADELNGAPTTTAAVGKKKTTEPSVPNKEEKMPVLKRERKPWNKYSFLTSHLAGLEHLDITKLMEVLVAGDGKPDNASNPLSRQLKMNSQDIFSAINHDKPNREILSKELVLLFHGFKELDMDGDGLISVDDLQEYVEDNEAKHMLTESILTELIFMNDNAMRNACTFDEIKTYYVHLKPQLDGVLKQWKCESLLDQEEARRNSMKEKRKSNNTPNREKKKSFLGVVKKSHTLAEPKTDFMPFLFYRLLMFAYFKEGKDEMNLLSAFQVSLLSIDYRTRYMSTTIYFRN